MRMGNRDELLHGVGLGSVVGLVASRARDLFAKISRRSLSRVPLT